MARFFEDLQANPFKDPASSYRGNEIDFSGVHLRKHRSLSRRKCQNLSSVPLRKRGKNSSACTNRPSSTDSHECKLESLENDDNDVDYNRNTEVPSESQNPALAPMSVPASQVSSRSLSRSHSTRSKKSEGVSRKSMSELCKTSEVISSTRVMVSNLVQDQKSNVDHNTPPPREDLYFVKHTSNGIMQPPINETLLRELQVDEILRNPKLRHDILFDPTLQFRPNGNYETNRKRMYYEEKYWNSLYLELSVYEHASHLYSSRSSLLVPLFNNLRQILISLLPKIYVQELTNTLDPELNIKKLVNKSFEVDQFASWLSTLLRGHCAPMRDELVSDMESTFKEAQSTNSLAKFVEGFRKAFLVLEAMKLDIVNCQIKTVRPMLIANSVDFERGYFMSLINRGEIDLDSSVKWLKNSMESLTNQDLLFDDHKVQNFSDLKATKDVRNSSQLVRELQMSNEEMMRTKYAPYMYKVLIRQTIKLLSCQKFIRKFPLLYSFDHMRFQILRVALRHIVCLCVCRVLFQKIVAADRDLEKDDKRRVNHSYSNQRLKQEIFSIATDEKGSCRWTKNVPNIVAHLYQIVHNWKLKHLDKDSFSDSGISSTESDESWIQTQFQPSSKIYGIFEERLLNLIEEHLILRTRCDSEGKLQQKSLIPLSRTGYGEVTQQYPALRSRVAQTTSQDNGQWITVDTHNLQTCLPLFGGNSWRSSRDCTDQRQRALYEESPSTTQDSDYFSHSHFSTSTSVFDTNGLLSGIEEFTEIQNVLDELSTVINFHWLTFYPIYSSALEEIEMCWT